jgi:hypothetical protein
MAKLATALFKTRSQAERAVEDLVDLGIAREDISLLMSDATSGAEFKIAAGATISEGSKAGAIGSALGALAAGFVSLGIISPGIGLVAAGPVLATLAGVGAGAFAGGLAGGLVGLGIAETDAEFYTEEIGRGRILLGVYADDDMLAQARRITELAGAERVT